MSNSAPTGAGAMPKPNYVNPINGAMPGLKAAIALLVIAWVAIGLRLSVKFLDDHRRWKLHDTFACLGIIFATAEVIVAGYDIEHLGLGRHIWDVPLKNLNAVYRLIDQRYIMYELAIVFIKLSILQFYLSLFAIKKNFRIATYTMMGIVVVYITIFVFIDAFRCRPLKAMWYPITYAKVSVCISGPMEQKAFGILNVVTDFITLLLPFPVLLKLHMSIRKRFMLAVIFALGLLTCAAAIVRTIVVWISFTNVSPDATWSTKDEITWMNVEMLIGSICGSLITTPALFRYIKTQTNVSQYMRSLISGSGSTKSRNGHVRIDDPEQSGSNGKGMNSRSDWSLRNKSIGEAYELNNDSSRGESRSGKGSYGELPPQMPLQDDKIGITKTITVARDLP